MKFRKTIKMFLIYGNYDGRNEEAVYIGEDQNFNKAHIKYLENKLYHRAKKKQIVIKS